jgi:hypothetical protein
MQNPRFALLVYVQSAGGEFVPQVRQLGRFIPGRERFHRLVSKMRIAPRKHKRHTGLGSPLVTVT